MKLTLNADFNDAAPLVEIDLGEPGPMVGTGTDRFAYLEQGDLTSTSGNLYLYVDGVEYGSLFLTVDASGNPVIELGQYDPDTEQWESRNPLTRPTADAEEPVDETPDHRPGTPFGIEGHRPSVPQAAGVAPWCECGYRQDLSDPDSLTVGAHITEMARTLGVPDATHAGWLR